MTRRAAAHARAALVVSAVVLGGALLASPSGATPSARSAPPRSQPVIEEDFHITAPDAVRAGRVSLRVANAGPDDHELLVVRRTDGELPLRRDGLTVDEKAIRPRLAGGLEAGGPGTVRTLRLRLRPGRYELFCNMSGHYLGGMETSFEVVR
jgi:uncharacterized cupredoxin-like copper-binding protein